MKQGSICTLTTLVALTGFTSFIILPGILTPKNQPVKQNSSVAVTKRPTALAKIKRKQVGASPLITVGGAATATSGFLSATGDENGVVTVTNTQTHATTTFQMTPGIWVRQVFFADNGQTIAAAQLTQTRFWNLATRQQTHSLQEEAYGMTPDGSKFFTYSSHNLNVYSYPGLLRLWQFPVVFGGPERWTFSPDSRYWAVTTDNTRPSPDNIYPDRIPVNSHHFHTTSLYDLTTGQSDPNTYRQLADTGGTFKADSRFYILFGSTWVDPNEVQNIDGNFQFEMATGNITQLP